MQYLFATVLFLAVGLLVWAALSSVFSDERMVSRRLEGLSAYEVAEAGVAHPQLRSFPDRVLSPGWSRMREGLTAMTSRATRGQLRHRLLLAGNPRGIDVGRFLGVKVLGVVGVTTLVLALAVVFRATPLAWTMGIMLGVASYWLPDLWLSSATSRR